MPCPYDASVAIDLIGSKRVEVASLVTHRLPLERTQEGFDLMTRQGGESIKVVVEPWRGKSVSAAGKKI